MQKYHHRAICRLVLAGEHLNLKDSPSRISTWHKFRSSHIYIQLVGRWDGNIYLYLLCLIYLLCLLYGAQWNFHKESKYSQWEKLWKKLKFFKIMFSWFLECYTIICCLNGKTSEPKQVHSDLRSGQEIAFHSTKFKIRENGPLKYTWYMGKSIEKILDCTN